MKRIILIVAVLFSVSLMQAQKDTSFYKHELRASFGGALLSPFWLQENSCYFNFSVSYFYRPVKWLWVGCNFINYFGERIDYHWREYSVDGSFKDFSKSKIKYCGVIAPEIRFSYLNKESVILYSALSAGVAFEDGYDKKWKKYPRIFPYFHLTCFGFSFNFGRNENAFMGMELGIGYKGLLQIHGGYRF